MDAMKLRTLQLNLFPLKNATSVMVGIDIVNNGATSINDVTDDMPVEVAVRLRERHV